MTGLQKFDGEDLNNKARTKYQQEQHREWCEKQKQEREQAEANQVITRMKYYEMSKRVINE